MFKDDYKVAYKRLCAPTNDDKPFIKVKDGYTYITNGFEMVVLPYEEGETNKDFSARITDYLNYDKHIELPTAKELRAEIKRRQIKRSNINDSNNIYMLAKGFAVNIFYLLDLVSVCGTDGWWNGVVSKGKYYVASGGLFIKGDIMGILLPIKIKEEWKEPVYPPVVEKPVSPYHEFRKPKAIENLINRYLSKGKEPRHSVEGDKVIFMTDIAAVRLDNQGMEYTNEQYDRKYFSCKCPDALQDFKLRNIKDTIKAMNITKKSPEKIMKFDYFGIDILLLRDIMEVVGDGTLYWDSNAVRTWRVNPNSPNYGKRVYDKLAYFKGEYGEAMICVCRI